MSYFPVFVELRDKKCIVVGGGAVSSRKVKMLLDFEAKIYVIAKDVSEELRTLSDRYSDRLKIDERAFADRDIEGAFLVIVATDDHQLNGHISALCKERNILVNVVDAREDCSFILSSYIKERDVVAAFSSGGKSPILSQYLKEKAREYVTEEMAEINECLGSIRKEVQTLFPNERIRKEVFEAVLNFWLSNNMIPCRMEIEAIITQFREKYEI